MPQKEKKKSSKRKWFRRILRFTLFVFLFFILALTAAYFAIQSPKIQSKLVNDYVIPKLNSEFNTQFSVDSVSIEFFGDVNLYNVSTKDHKKEEFIDIPRIKVSTDLKSLIQSIYYNKDLISLDYVKLYKPKIKVVTYKGEADSNFIQFIDLFDDGTTSESSNFIFKGNFDIEDGELLIKNMNLPLNEQVWLDSKQFNTSIKNFEYNDSGIFAELKTLTLQATKNGELYEMQEFTTDFKYSKNRMEFNEIQLKTQNSNINGNLAFSYENIGQFSYFNDSIQWDLNIENQSIIHFKDIRYWTPGWEKDNSAILKGKVTGTLNDLLINNLELKTNNGNNTIIAKYLNLKNVVNPDDLYINASKLSVKSSYEEITQFLPQEYAKDIDPFVKKLNKIEYNGDFNYDSSTIIAKGNAKTGIGNALLDVAISNYTSANDIAYEGTIDSKSFNLKELLENKDFNEVGGKINFKGKGTDLAKLEIDSNGTVYFIDLFGKRYHNIELNGGLKNEKFNGFASINDSNLKLDYNGVLDFSQPTYYLNFNSQVQHLDLDYLGVTENRSIVSTNVKGELYFQSLDDFQGALDLKNIKYRNRENTLELDEASFSSENIASGKHLLVQIPGYLYGEVKGRYVLTELPDVILNSFSDLIIDYKLKNVSENQDFEYSAEFQQNILEKFYPDLNIAPETSVYGTVNTNENITVAHLNTPSLKYAGLDFLGINVDINNQRTDETAIISSDSIQYQGITIKDINIKASPENEFLNIKTQFKTGNENPVFYHLNFEQRVTPENEIELGIKNSEIIINNESWALNPTNDFYSNKALLNFEKNQYKIQPITIENGSQKITLNGFYTDENNYDFNAEIKTLVLSSFIPKDALGDIEFDGIADGDIRVLKNENLLKPTTNLIISDILFNGYEIGNLSLDGLYDTGTEKINLNGILNKGDEQPLFLVGYIDNSTDMPNIDLDVSFLDFDLAFLGGFLEGVVSNLTAKTNGNLKFKGDITNPSYSGAISLKDLGLTVDYLNTTYNFAETDKIVIAKDPGITGTILLNNLKFQDDFYKTNGNLDGFLLFNDLSDWYYNLSFQSENLLVLNTTEYHNELFYGQVLAKGNFLIEGDTENVLIEARGTKKGQGAKVNANSELTINTGSYFVSTDTSLVRFINLFDNENSKSTGTTTATNLKIDLEVEVDDKSIVNLLFDSSTDDKLWARGSTPNNLKIKMNKKGDLFMDGEYIVSHGVYELRRLPTPKDFIIAPGGTITWFGSPYNADIDITARYPKIVSNVGEYLGLGASSPQQVNLEIKLTETLEKPVFTFDINLPKVSSDTQNQLDKILKYSPEETFRQFGFILFTGQFGASDTNIFNDGGTIAKTAAADIGLRQLSNLFSSIAKEVQINFGYTSGDNLSETSDRINATVNLTLHPRWTLRGAGGLPVNNAYNESLTLDIEAEYDASKNRDKSLLLKGFSRPTTFGVLNANNSSSTSQSYGVGISYTKSFNKIGDLFKKQSKIDEEKRKNDSLRQIFNERRKQRLDSIRSAKPIKDNTLIQSDSINSNRIKPDSLALAPKPRPKKGLVRFK